MQQCGICLKVYDESEYSYCPYCEGSLDDTYEDYEEETEDEEEISEENKRFFEIVSCAGVYDEEDEYIRCPTCGCGLHMYNGIPTCPKCGPF